MCLEHISGEKIWKNELLKRLSIVPVSFLDEILYKHIRLEYEKGFNPIEKIAEIIVGHRLCNFGNMLSSFGYNMHLITLPEFHITAFNMYKLSNNFMKDGINAFVKDTQRPERMLSQIDSRYTYYKHQTATGTGLEAEFAKVVGSDNVNILNDSTELDDIKKRN